MTQRTINSPRWHGIAEALAHIDGPFPLAAVLEARRAELDARLAQIGFEQSAARAWAWLATLESRETTR